MFDIFNSSFYSLFQILLNYHYKNVKLWIHNLLINIGNNNNDCKFIIDFFFLIHFNTFIIYMYITYILF